MELGIENFEKHCGAKNLFEKQVRAVDKMINFMKIIKHLVKIILTFKGFFDKQKKGEKIG